MKQINIAGLTVFGRIVAGTALLAITTMSVTAAEPTVVETKGADGRSDLRVLSTDGKQLLGAYTVNLNANHQPATHDVGPIREWEKYRFGAFLCFNDNQFNGNDNSVSQDASIFNPTTLDIADWVRTFKKANMKYAVLTVRHTSGFLLWDSLTSEHDVGNSPGNVDVLGEYVKECRKQGIAPGIYYCMWGNTGWSQHRMWWNGRQRGPYTPGKANPNARAIILAQLHEISSKYGEIPYFWVDVPKWRADDLSMAEVYALLKNNQPNCVVMSNQGGKKDDPKMRQFPVDAFNGEVTVPDVKGYKPFRKIGDNRYYLPFEFEPVSQYYRKGRGTLTPWGRKGVWFTYGEGKNWEASYSLPAPVMFNWIKSAYDNGSANVLLSTAPDYTGRMRPNDAKELVALGKLLKEAGLLDVPPATPHPEEALSTGKKASASAFGFPEQKKFIPDNAFDDNPDTLWGADHKDKSGWLAIDLGKPVLIGRAVVQEGYNRTQKFAIEYQVGEEWKPLVTGATLGAHRVFEFKPVTAQNFRLNIIQAISAPAIWEFQLFAPEK